MRTMFGADVEALAGLGSSFVESAETLETARRQVDGIVATAGWVGPDAEEFRLDWSRRLAPALASCLGALRDNAEVLRRNAEDQARTSAADGGAGPGPDRGGRPGAGGGGDRSGDGGKDRPGNPDLSGHGPWVDVPPTIPLDDAALDPNMINQQGLGDCWLLAGLGAVARDDPQFIRDHMKLNADGTWTVTMYKDGDPVEITVEPEVAQDGVMDPSGNPSWASIYEKAAAEYWGGSYDDIDGGYSSDAFAAITGATPSQTGEGNLSDLKDRLADGPVALGTEDEPSWWPFGDEVDDSRVVPNHAYIVDKVEERDGELKVHVINPWGPGAHLQNDGSDKVGDMWLTEKQYKENFDTVYAVPSTR